MQEGRGIVSFQGIKWEGVNYKMSLESELITTMDQSQDLVRYFAQRNGWKDIPNIDKFDHLHEELIEMSRYLRYKSEEERKKFVEGHREIFIDGIGDLYFGLCRLANQLGVNIGDSFNQVRSEIMAKYPASVGEQKVVYSDNQEVK